MTYWRMTKKVQAHPAIAADEQVIQASYGLSSKFIQFANRVDGIPRYKSWNDEMGEAKGLAHPLRHSGVLALTDRRLLFFRKRFAIGRPKTISGEWRLDQVEAIDYDETDNILSVTFTDQSNCGLHSPRNQSPHVLAEGFTRMKAESGNSEPQV